MGNVGWAELGRGKADLMLGNYLQAKVIFEGILAKNDKIMAAYDYLAQTLAKLEKHKEAQQVLMKATNISPRAIMRQKALGNLAYRNDDFSVAENSFKKAVEHGKYSCMRSPSDYTSLAKTLVHLDASEESLDVLNVALKEFPDSDEAKLHVSVTESYVYKKMNREEDARKAMAEANTIAESIAGGIPPEVELELAKTYIMMGEEEKGTKIIKRIVQCNYDREETIDIVKTVFKEVGREDNGQQFIDRAKDEIIALNNEGVALTQEGRIEEAIDYFEKAALHVPENKIINANAAQVLMLYMKEYGVNEEKIAKTKMYLDMVKKIDDHYKDLPMLQAMYNELVPG